ncbi:MAG: fasciclin domain-containing protein [Pedobacter sp.]|uniref:fasciclin domain-containing protein n=1 Tax=Pedobacter sp. TaxID=1411316 RepID=UPI0028065DB6|nr:fasciclin domain-containing protein [Pedobacter sp.]MDQ8006693.1 fasciclin domain-containing protein [Pedobacter sp.]
MMKKLNIRALLVMLLAIGLFISCQKDKYYFDSGTQKGTFDGSVLAFLKSKPQYFDTLTRVIEIAGMNDYFDKEQDITFFAPTSSTIYKSIRGLNAYLMSNGRDTVTKLDQIKPEAWKELLSLYVFKGKNKLKDYPQIDTLNLLAFAGQGYTSINGRTMSIGVLFNDAVSRNASGVEISRVKYAGYRQLYLSYIPNYATPKVGLKHAPVASSDIAPRNGIVHVLAQETNDFNASNQAVWVSKHNFGFHTDIFINTVQSYGILPPTP